MCGIGALFTREPSHNLEATALAMAQKQRHRGPDWQATYLAPHHRVALSHARLSIVDLSPAGNQPLPNETEDLWLVCNGEVYNHLELRASLEAKGHQFRSHSDNEVLLHLYEEYGTEMLSHLHGMFAFVLYDSKQETMFCARDRVGKKPLVYAETPQGVAIASEIPAVRCFPGIDTRPDPVAFGLYLLRNLRHIPEPWTFYAGIRRLMPGHALLVQAGRVTKTWRYWQPTFAIKETSGEELLESLDRAVGMRMVADVEVGALLSGGVDSSAIVQAMVAQGATGMRTYAMGLNTDDEELRRARIMAERLGTRHTEFTFDPSRQHEQLETLIRIHGEPIMLLPLTFAYELCERIRDDGLRVVMTGHGADELYYGYPGNNNLALLSAFLPFVPAGLRPLLGILAQRFAPGSRTRETLLVAASPVGERKAALYKDEAKQLWGELLCLQSLEKLVECTISEWLETWFETSKPNAYIDEANILGLMHENSHSVTIAGDLPAMAASVEARCPFLDQDLVQLAWQTHHREKVPSIHDPSQNKGILKKALEGRVPKELLYAPKRGFGYYIREEDVLRGPWQGRVEEAFEEMDDLGGCLNVAAVQNLKARYDANDGVQTMLIAKLYATYLFQRQNG